RRVVLRLFQEFGRDAPEFLGAHARRKPAGPLGAIDQPIGLRIGGDQRCREKLGHVPSMTACPPLSQPQPRSSPARAPRGLHPACCRRRSGAGTTYHPQRSRHRLALCAPRAARTACPSSATPQWGRRDSQNFPPFRSSSLRTSRPTPGGSAAACFRPRPWRRTPSDDNGRGGALSSAAARAAGSAGPRFSSPPTNPSTTAHLPPATRPLRP